MIIVLLVVIIGYFGYQQYMKKPKAQVVVQEQESSASYNGPHFSFSYPKQYTLAETPEGVRVTSSAFPQEARKSCLAIKDEQDRIVCLDKLVKVSPNILITFLPGNAQTLWESKKISESGNTFTANSNTYQVGGMGGEYGGVGNYGLLLDDGLLLASYVYEDSDGGVQFNNLKSNTYQLTNADQKKLLEEILSTLTIVKVQNTSKAPELSSSKKSITANNGTILEITDKAIMDFFKKNSTGMCDDANNDNTSTRAAFCTKESVFREKSSFTKIIPSSNGSKIGFVIATDELTPDSVVGVFYPYNTTYKVHLLTSYYLGNDFVGFSPNDAYLVTKDSCFEGVCGFTVYNAATLSAIKHFGNSETGPANTFVRWTSNTQFQYTVGAENRTYTIPQ